MASPQVGALRFSRSSDGSQASQLLRMRVSMRGKTTFYLLDMTNGRECWAVARRYNEFRSCRAQLHENFSQSEFPAFPPKESLVSSIFGTSKTDRARLADTRCLQLRQWLEGALCHNRASQFPPLRAFLEEPSAGAAFATSLLEDSFQEGGSFASSFAEPAEVAPVALSSVRTRLAGPRGEIQIIVRAVGALRPHKVQLALCASDGAVHTSLEIEMTPAECGASEGLQQLTLRPGSTCEISATPVGPGGVAGSAVCLQLQLPGPTQLAALFPEDARRAAAPLEVDVEPASCGSESGCCLESPAASDVSTEAPEDEEATEAIEERSPFAVRRLRLSRRCVTPPRPRRVSNSDNGRLMKRLSEAGFAV